MIAGLVAAFQLAVLPPEVVWADIYINDTRGGDVRIEILPQIAIEDERRYIRSVTARQTKTFMGRTTEVNWTDAESCPGLRTSLDSIAEVRVLADKTLSSYHEGPAYPSPPPPHRSSAVVTIGALEMSAWADSSLGEWVQGVIRTTDPCWLPDQPAGSDGGAPGS